MATSRQLRAAQRRAAADKAGASDGALQLSAVFGERSGALAVRKACGATSQT